MTSDGRFPEELLSAYLDGECTDAERVEVERRVASDPVWRSILDDVARARAALRGLPEREPPAGFWLRVLTNVAEIAEADRGGTAAAAVVAGVALAAPERHQSVSPNVASLTDSHAATASMQSDPVSNLAPAAVPVEMQVQP
jgi:anti-sigma factor RsiW